MPLSRLVPADLAAPDTAPDDPRLGRWLAAQRRMTGRTRVALVGVPTDEGVRRNGGRPGAAGGPAALRAALYAMTPDACDPDPFEALLGRTADLGDLPVTGDVEADQAALGAVVAALLDADVTPILLGGGHETAYGHALGYLASGHAVHLLNWDAHADVRPLRAGRAHSGSPFRQALEHPSGFARSYTVAGLHPWRVSAAHRAFVERHGRIVWARDLSAERAEALAREAQAPTLASFDLDAVDGLPGVSAPGDGGVPVSVWLRAAEACGTSAAVRSFDVVELNPAADPSGRSARLAALTVWHILRGLARRAFNDR